MRPLRPRVVRADRPHAATIPIAATSQDSLLSAIIKWIPVEVIGSYEFLSGLIPADQLTWVRAIALSLLVLTPVWIFLSTSDSGKSPAWRQVVLSPFAYAVWIVAIDPHVTAGVAGWKAWMGSVVLAIGTLVLPLLDEVLKRLGLDQN